MENEGDDLAKNADFQRRTLSLGWPFYMKKFRAVRAAFFHFIEKWGGRFGENWRFSKKKMSLVGHFIYVSIFSAARAAFIISWKNGGTIRRKLAIFKEDN